MRAGPNRPELRLRWPHRQHSRSSADPCNSPSPRPHFRLPPSPACLAERLQQGLWTLTGLYLLVGVIWLLLGNRLLNLAGAAMPERWSDASFLVLSSIVIHLVLRRFTGLIVDEYAQLAQSEALLQAKFLALPSPAFIYDLATMRILDANPAALEFFGWERDEFLQQTLQAIWPNADGERLEEIIAQIRGKGDATCVLNEDLMTRSGRGMSRCAATSCIWPAALPVWSSP